MNCEGKIYQDIEWEQYIYTEGPEKQEISSQKLNRPNERQTHKKN